MVDAGFYLVTKEIALRSGMVDTRYRTQDGRFILNDRDLSRIRFSPNEYLTGLQGIERISASEANTLIAKNKNAMGIGQEEDVVEEPKIEEAQQTESTNVEEPVVEEEPVTDEPKVEETEEAQGEPQEEPKKTTTKRK